MRADREAPDDLKPLDIAPVMDSFGTENQKASEVRSVGVNIGIVIGGLDERGPEGFIREADSAVYRAKEAGKNRSAVYEP